LTETVFFFNRHLDRKEEYRKLKTAKNRILHQKEDAGQSYFYVSFFFFLDIIKFKEKRGDEDQLYYFRI